MKIEAGRVAHNTLRLERVMRVLDANRLSNFLLTEDTHIRFTYDGTRYIYYHNGHVTIAEPGVEIGATPEGEAMEHLLDV